MCAFCDLAHGEPFVVGIGDKDVESDGFCTSDFIEGVADESRVLAVGDYEFEGGEVFKGAVLVVWRAVEFFVDDLEVCGPDAAEDHGFE